MALFKEIELENGVVTNYHRIVSVNKVTNNANIIEVASYTSEEKRQEEIEKQGQPTNIFIHTRYISKTYNANETIVDLYNYLKTIEPFIDAEDVYEEGEIPEVSEIEEKAQAYDILTGSIE